MLQYSVAAAPRLKLSLNHYDEAGHRYLIGVIMEHSQSLTKIEIELGDAAFVGVVLALV